MGICCVLKSLSDINASRILADPPLIWRLIAPDDSEIYLECVGANKKPGFFSRLFGARSALIPEELPNFSFCKGENLELDLDKAWHGIHFCLNKSADDGEFPFDFLVRGGKEVGKIEVGYGPARIFTDKEVKKIWEAISHISTESLRKNYQPDQMESLEIYPGIWARDGEEAFSYLEENFNNLKKFLNQCVINNFGLAIYFS